MLLAGLAAAVAAVSLVASASAATSPDLTRSLRAGGLVLVLRHAHTDQSKQDEDPVVVSDCTTQRNLGTFTRFPLRAGADVRQLLGRPGELWGAESGADRLVVIRC